MRRERFHADHERHTVYSSWRRLWLGSGPVTRRLNGMYGDRRTDSRRRGKARACSLSSQSPNETVASGIEGFVLSTYYFATLTMRPALDEEKRSNAMRCSVVV